MKKLKIGDIITWNIQKGINPKGRVIEILENYGFEGDTRYVVESLDSMSWYSKRINRINAIHKGDILQPFKPKKVK